jgi:hypothetical protein
MCTILPFTPKPFNTPPPSIPSLQSSIKQPTNQLPTPDSPLTFPQQAAGSALACTLKDGVLKDPYNRIGSVVANYQFQFDGPPQAGAIYTGGFSVCKNGSLALGDSAIWWRCMSGEFGNLYDRWIGDQCSEVRIVAQMMEEEGEEEEEGKPTPTPTPTPTSEAGPKETETETKEGAAKSSSWSVESASITASVSTNQTTVSTNLPETQDSPSTSPTTAPPAGPSATDAASTDEPPAPTGAAVPGHHHLPRQEALGAAVVAVLGAAWLL